MKTSQLVKESGLKRKITQGASFWRNLMSPVLSQKNAIFTYWTLW